MWMLWRNGAWYLQRIFMKRTSHFNFLEVDSSWILRTVEWQVYAVDDQTILVLFLKIYEILQSNTTFYCIKYTSKRYLKDNDNYMFRLSFLSHRQVVNLGYFNIQFTLLLGTRSRLHKFYRVDHEKVARLIWLLSYSGYFFVANPVVC